MDYAERHKACEEAYRLFVQGKNDEALERCRAIWPHLVDESPEAEYVLALESRLGRPSTRARNRLRRLDFEKERLNGSLLTKRPLQKGDLNELMEQVFVSALGGGPRLPVRQVETWLEANLALLRRGGRG